MRRMIPTVLGATAMAVQGTAAPLHVALADFEDESGLASDPLLGGGIAPGALARKGALVLGKQLASNPSF